MENWVTIAIIYVDAYLIILGLIKRELQYSDFDNNKRIRLRLAYIKFQQLFYIGSNNRSLAIIKLLDMWKMKKYLMIGTKKN